MTSGRGRGARERKRKGGSAARSAGPRPPFLLMADKEGRLFEHPTLLMMGASGRRWRVPSQEELIGLPVGTDTYVLPGRRPVGYDPETGRAVPVLTFDGKPVWAVAAFLPPAHTALLWSAFVRETEAPVLPLYAYCAVGWKGRRFVVPAARVDADRRQDLDRFPRDGRENFRAAEAMLRHPENRLIRHLAHCCTVYRCPAARNLFLDRAEAPLPTARGCNARCLGCISLQPSDCIPATQDRIAFRPTSEEIAEVAVDHIRRAKHPVVSFGQGCEGEPLTEWRLLESAIRRIRAATPLGTVNLNTNASKPEAVSRLIDAGLDSIRVSLNSAREDLYTRYFRPKNYAFSDVVETIRLVKRRKRFVSVNYFVFPGLTDESEEAAALETLWKDTGFDMIQWRNLNIDPDFYMDALNWDGGETAMGVLSLMERVRERMPGVRFGYFNPYLAPCYEVGTKKPHEPHK